MPLIDFDLRDGGRTVAAYAATFSDPYEVRDQYGHYDEVINRTAFDEAIRSGVGSVGVFLSHGTVPLGEPVSIHADRRGLVTLTRYNKSALGEAILSSWRNGEITAQSWSGSAVRTRRLSGSNGRPVLTVERSSLDDYGPCPYPHNPNAGLIGIWPDEEAVARRAGWTSERLLGFGGARAMTALTAEIDPHLLARVGGADRLVEHLMSRGMTTYGVIHDAAAIAAAVRKWDATRPGPARAGR